MSSSRAKGLIIFEPSFWSKSHEYRAVEKNFCNHPVAAVRFILAWKEGNGWYPSMLGNRPDQSREVVMLWGWCAVYWAVSSFLQSEWIPLQFLVANFKQNKQDANADAVFVRRTAALGACELTATTRRASLQFIITTYGIFRANNVHCICHRVSVITGRWGELWD